MYGVARKRADLLKMSLVTSAAMWVICLLAVVETTNAAEAEDSLPQNGKIAFTSFHANEHSDHAIYTVDPDGSSLRQLTNIPGEHPPAWSPDGTRIAYAVVPYGLAGSDLSEDGYS